MLESDLPAASVLILISFFGLPLQEWCLVRWFHLVYLGKISYGLYAYHFLALLLARILSDPVSPVLYGPYILIGTHPDDCHGNRLIHFPGATLLKS